MIYRMACDLQENLHARKWPVLVEYARRTQRVGRYSMVIVVARDTETGDTVAAPRGSLINPQKTFTRPLGVVADLFVKSSVSGARRNEHEHECDDLVDAVLTGLYQWAAASKAGAIDVTEARYLSDEEIDESDRSNGVVYRLRFKVPRGVVTRDYGGAARETATIAEVGTASTGAILQRPDGSHETVPDTEPGD